MVENTLIYLSSGRIPTEKANGLQIVQMCHAFTSHVREVLLMVPKRKNLIAQDVFSYYHLPPTFHILYLSVWDLVDWGKIAYIFHRLMYAVTAARWITRQKEPATIYARDHYTAGLLCFLGLRNIFWEAHEGNAGPLIRYLLSHAAGIICISEGVKNALQKQTFVSETRFLVAPDGVDMEEYANLPEKSVCRERVGMRNDQRILLYTGHLYEWKGVHTLAEAARLLPPEIQVWFLGGTEEDIRLFQERYKDVKNVTCLGHVDHARVAEYQRAADVVVLPNSAKSSLSKHYTSPLKLFEYMASGTPILATDIPSLREILDDETAAWCPPDDPKEMAEALQKICLSYDQAEKRAASAMARIHAYDWQNRAKSILAFIDKRLSHVQAPSP